MLASLFFALLPAFPAADPARDVVAVQAGTVHVVAEGRVIAGGGTVLVRAGKIVAVGATGAVEVPADARVVDYGPDAVIVPGLISAGSTFAGRFASDRTADPGIRAVDAFDTYARYTSSLAEGVTSAYVTPASGRLIAGQGAVVKLAGEPGPGRFLSASAAIEGSISSDARNVAGYWEPPIPATVDVGLGIELRQLPRTTMGAIVALRELLALAGQSAASDEYGPYAGPELAELLARNKPWRMRGETAGEIRALLAFFAENGLPLVLCGASDAGDLAEEIARSGASVVWNVSAAPGGWSFDRGKDEDSRWLRYDVAARLAEQNVRFAIAPSSGPYLRFAAVLATTDGLSADAALRALTLSPAEILGVADRVGSLAPGRDADLVVLNGPPIDPVSSVVATWVDGEIAWKAHETAATVIEVEELHVGDGEVLAPGQVLLLDGLIAEVGRRVAHPFGCTVVRGRAAMPGMIDARGHLGLEGSTKTPSLRYELKRLVEPGGFAERRVAQAGVTTVLLSPRGISSGGVPAMAYKPAGSDVATMVVADPAAMVVQWSPRTRVNRHKAGDAVRDLFGKGADYKRRWDEYEEALRNWTPPPPAPPKEEKADDDKSDEKEEEDEKESEKKDEAAERKPLTGSWDTRTTDPASGDEVRLRIRLLETESELEGTLRCAAVSADLVLLSGSFADGELQLSGLGTRGRIEVEATLKEVEKKAKPKRGKQADDEEAEPERRRIAGKLRGAGIEIEFEAPQIDEEYPVARRPERRKETPASEPEPKGKPRPPSVNADLEVVRKALEGRLAVVVEVFRADEVLACVDFLAGHGVRPILLGADDAWRIAGELRGRVSGVLLDHAVIGYDEETGTRRRNRYAELQANGIRVAFHSGAEEGAAGMPVMAAFAVSAGMSPEGAVRALTSDAADMFLIGERVGRLSVGRDADVLLLDGSPLHGGVSVQRAWVSGREVRLR